jgi:hypothetical protein
MTLNLSCRIMQQVGRRCQVNVIKTSQVTGTYLEIWLRVLTTRPSAGHLHVANSMALIVEDPRLTASQSG